MKNKVIVIDTQLNTILFDNTKYYDVPKEILLYIEQLEECYCNRTDCIGRIKDSKKYDSLLQKYKQLENNRDKAIRTLESLKGSARWERHLYEVDYMLDILKGDNK
ncbi:MAG: hypothetical protein IJV15_00065 [Lachnospiraceae bacterium]|nr:hypothetical protein [Lachnospiraceae bacterium]